MDCRDFLARYSDYDDSLLSTAELDRFSAHLSGCSSCARYDRVLRKGRMLARQVPPVQPSPDFAPRLQSKLWRMRSERRRAPAPVLGGAAAGLAGMTVLLGSLWAASLLDDTGSRGVAGADAPLVQPHPSPAPAAGGEVARHALPAFDPPPPREWGARRVDPRASVAYSPLVFGPPAYRAPASFPAGAVISTSHPLD